jgi:hypothetical protein
MPVKWQSYPRWQPPNQLVHELVAVFEDAQPEIGTPKNQKKSNQTLAAVADGLKTLGFRVEDQPKVGSEDRKKKVKVPVLFGENGRPIKTFEVDAWRESDGAVVEVEAGSAVDARKVFQDLFEAAVIPEVSLLCVAVMNGYLPARRKTPFDDFQRAKNIFDTFDASHLDLPFATLLLVGY